MATLVAIPASAATAFALRILLARGPYLADVGVFPAASASHVGVDGHEIPIMTTHLDDALGRDVVVLAEELQFHQVHHVSVGQDDGSPFLAILLLVVTEGASVRRPTHDRDGDVIDLRTHAEPD